MSDRGDLPGDLRDRLHAASASVIEDAGPDWASVVGLACDLVASGPLENFIRDDEPTLRWVEEQASVSPKFRLALAHAWLSDLLSPESFARVERFADPRPSTGGADGMMGA